MASFLVLWFGFSLAVGFLAQQRGRGLFSWFLISAAVSPVLAFALLMMLKDLALVDAIDTISHNLELTHVHCEHCGEYILPEATVCPYCRKPVTPQPDVVKRRMAEKIAETQTAQATTQGNLIIIIGIMVGISIIAWLFTFLR